MMENDFEIPRDPANEINLSDADFDAMLRDSLGATGDPGESVDGEEEPFQPGDPVAGTVIEVRDSEVLVEIGWKSHGLIDTNEFDGSLPSVGDPLNAHYERFDPERTVGILTVREARKELFWQTVQVGEVYEGVAVEVNKGGLTLDIRGERAFMPVSQIDRSRVEDPALYLGQTLCCEVTSVDRERGDLVVSRRNVLDREFAENRVRELGRFRVGDVVAGKVVRVNEHGAFVSLGAVEGLLHASKFRSRRELGDRQPLREGEALTVEIVHLDPEAGRVGLDFRAVSEDPWDRVASDYHEGDEVTGLVTRVTPEGATVQIDENLEGFMPAATLHERQVSRGTVLKARIRSIDPTGRAIELG